MNRYPVPSRLSVVLAGIVAATNSPHLMAQSASGASALEEVIVTARKRDETLMDVPVAQTALSFGADDVDGTVVEERIYHDAGATTPQEVERAELVRWIRDAGRVPVERDTLYNVVWSADPTLAPVGAPAPVGR